MSVIKIEVTDNISKPRKAGERTAREQACYIQIPGEKYPTKFRFTVWDEEMPLDPGIYNMDVSACLYVGQYDSLSFRIDRDALKKAPARKAGGADE